MTSKPNKQYHLKQQQQKVEEEKEEVESRCSRRNSKVSVTSSPEFEFWNIVRNPCAFPPPTLLPADQLFSHGFLLPLHSHPNPPEHEPIRTASHVSKTEDESLESSSASITTTTTTLTPSKRWKLGLFKKPQRPNNNKNQDSSAKEKKDKQKTREKKTTKTGTGTVTGTGAGAELNINIWPFSRSRSAGNGTTRPKISPATRKASSAPCSRSNSSGESKSSRKSWPSSPGRGGVHLGRSSPVWHVRRSSGSGSGWRNSEAAFRIGQRLGSGTSTKESGNSKNLGNKAKVLSIDVPTCIGYRHHLTCKSYVDKSAISVGSSNNSHVSGNSNLGIGSSSNSSNLFSLRGLFTKKVY